MSASDEEKTMDETKSADQPGTPCCAGDSKQECECTGSAAGCGCGSGPAPRSWIKTLISAVVILAALGVGVYSLVASRASGQGGSTASAGNSKPAAAAILPSAAPPAHAPSPCCGSAGAEAAPQPSCCGGAASAPAEQPTCGEAHKGCCGH